VAIARALALRPEILLLDEVTSALDPELVTEVLDTIRSLAREGMTLLIVSHEMAFVREVANRVVLMDKGKVIEEGPPVQVLDKPATARGREFMGKILRH
jgi:polar amino acid transport system ATP-binding protein